MPAIFAAERTLGRLAKWLRLMGFDTLSEIDYPRGSFLPRIGPQRVFLTRTQRLRDAAVGLKTIFIQANDPRFRITSGTPAWISAPARNAEGCTGRAAIPNAP